jgi:hypothetical protein
MLDKNLDENNLIHMEEIIFLISKEDEEITFKVFINLSKIVD